MPHPAIDQILSFWFGDAEDDAEVDSAQGKLWWRGDDATDEAIREKFGELHERAKRRELDDWTETPRGRLALVILLDQFARNIHRRTHEAFAADPIALEVALAGIDCGDDVKLRCIERCFLYMPLMHAEDRDVQKQSVATFQRLVDSADPAHKKIFAGHRRFAGQHAKIVERFGRYPHRNEVLGRASTDEERAFLVEDGTSFGQGKKA